MNGPQQISDKKIMGELFRSRLEMFENAVELTDLVVHRHDPAMIIDKRVVLVKYELTLKLRDGSSAVKVLRGSAGQGNKRMKSFYILKTLWENGFDVGTNVIPKPLGYFPDFHLLLYENYKGESLMQRIQSGHNHYQEATEAAVNWLAEFHEKKPKNIPGADFNWEEQEREQDELLASLSNKFTNLTDRIRTVADNIMSLEHKLLEPKDFTLVHGDFQPNNILMNPPQTAVIDFNDAFLYNELFDLAYFSTQVKFMLKNMQNIDLTSSIDQMEKDYLTRRNIEPSEINKKKIALFKAKTLLKIKILTTHGQGAELLNEIENYVHQAT